MLQTLSVNNTCKIFTFKITKIYFQQAALFLLNVSWIKKQKNYNLPNVFYYHITVNNL